MPQPPRGAACAAARFERLPDLDGPRVDRPLDRTGIMNELHPTSPTYPPAFRIEPGERFGGAIRLPGSKSITNRALLIAGLARGESLLENALFCDDSEYLSAALIKLGVVVARDERSAHFRVMGAGGSFPVHEADVFLGNAGTATRFLTAALCLPGGRYTVDGDERMRERPIGELVRALRDLGADIEAPTGRQ